MLFKTSKLFYDFKIILEYVYVTDFIFHTYVDGNMKLSHFQIPTSSPNQMGIGKSRPTYCKYSVLISVKDLCQLVNRYGHLFKTVTAG